MARSRNIKPAFFRNEDLVELPFETRLLFIGLWTLADKAGRLEDRPKKVKMEVFPADDVDVSCMLHALAMHGFLQRYSVSGKRYIQVVNFARHQSPHHKEQESELPGPDLADDSNKKTPCESSSCSCMSHERSMHDSSMTQAWVNKVASTPLIPDSLIPDSLIPDSLIPDTGYLIPDTPTSASDDARQPMVPVGSDLPEVETPQAEPSPRPKQSPDYTPEFEAFWKAYPNGKSKKTAASAYKSALKRHGGDVTAQMLLDDVTARAKSWDWRKDGGKFVPMASTYLNGDRWEDPVGDPCQMREVKPSRHTGFDQIDYSAGIIQGVPDGVANF